MSLIIVEGNISAGKSTLTRDLASSLGYRVFLEPTSTNPYLADFYREPKKFALKMQVYLLRRRFHTYIEALKHVLETGQGAVLDRSIFSDWVFAEKNRLDGNIDVDGFFYYTSLRDQMLRDLPFPHVTLYLDVAAEECHKRIHGLRKRAAEVDSGIPLAYLQGLDGCYRSFLANMKAHGSEVISVPWAAFGSVEQVREAMQPTLEQAAPWNPDLLSVVSSEQLMQQRMRVRRGNKFLADHEDDDDMADLIGFDLEASNNAELQAVTRAPPSPIDDASQ